MKRKKAIKLLAALYLLHAVITTIKSAQQKHTPVNYPKGGIVPEGTSEPVRDGGEFVVNSKKALKNRLLRNVSPN